MKKWTLGSKVASEAMEICNERDISKLRTSFLSIRVLLLGAVGILQPPPSAMSPLNPHIFFSLALSYIHPLRTLSDTVVRRMVHRFFAFSTLAVPGSPYRPVHSRGRWCSFRPGCSAWFVLRRQFHFGPSLLLIPWSACSANHFGMRFHFRSPSAKSHSALSSLFVWPT